MKYDNFIQLSIIIFLAVASVLFFLPSEWALLLYHPGYVGAIFLVSAFLVYLPQAVFRPRLPEEKYLVKKIQAILALALLLNAAGELGAYKMHLIGFEYDKLVHLMNSILFVIALGEVLRAWKRFPFRYIRGFALLAVFLAGMGWEVWEITSDKIFNTLEWGVYGENINKDTFGDVMWNLVGITLGAQIKIRVREKPVAKK